MRILLPFATLSACVAAAAFALTVPPSGALGLPSSLAANKNPLCAAFYDNDKNNKNVQLPGSPPLTAHFPDPWVTQSPGHISCWEFYGLHGHLPRDAALQAWTQAYTEASAKLRAGRADEPMGTQTRHWVGRDEEGTGEIVDVVLMPEAQMTWRMVWEVWRAVRALICWDGRGFQFLVMTRGVEGEVGIGETKVRGEGVGERGRKGKREVVGVEGGRKMVDERSETKAGGLRSPAGGRVDGNSTTAALATTVIDPFIWHHTGMVCTWVFFGYFGHMDYNAAAMAARSAYYEASDPYLLDTLMGTETRIWTGVYRDAEPVQFVLRPRAFMTWRMLMEGITGAQMVVGGGQELQFGVLVDGMPETAGYGWVKRRSTNPNWRMAGARNETGSNGTWPSELAASLTAMAEAKAEASPVNNVTSLANPYVRHDAGMVTTWEYYGYRGSLDAEPCQRAWLQVNEYVVRKRNSGQIDAPIGREILHWPVRSGSAWVDLVIHPRENMTWRMLGEGVVGGVTVCSNVARDYQFILFVDGDEGELGFGQVTARDNEVSTS